MFVNRSTELAALARWWDLPGASLGIVWGRRRVGKTALLEHFAADLPVVFHTAAGRPLADELQLLSRAVGSFGDRLRDFEARPFAAWEDALEALAAAARRRRLLVVLDEFPELVRTSPDLPGRLRAFWDRARGQTKLKLLLCGSAVRTMDAMRREREPLYGRFDLSLLVQPFRPHEAARMLPALDPADRALVWGIVGGVPLYLEWWDERVSVSENLLRLVCSPGGQLLTEGQLVLATEAESGDLARLALRAIAAGRTKHNEIEQAVRADPTRTLERLVELQLVERMVPVTEDPRRTRRRLYRVADNFLAFWLSVVDRHRTAIERGLGANVAGVLASELDDHMGERFEAAFRDHLALLAAEGRLGEEVIDIGRWWADSPSVEIDAVAVAGRSRTPVLAGEAKWSRRIDARRLVPSLERKSERLPDAAADLRYALCAREAVDHGENITVITAADIFGS